MSQFFASVGQSIGISASASVLGEGIEIAPLFLKKSIYLFLFLSVLGLHCCTQAFSSCGEQELFSSGAWAPHSGGFSCGAGALERTCSVLPGALERTSSVVVARGLSCSAACRILVPD